jgi:hypothetical protein
MAPRRVTAAPAHRDRTLPPVRRSIGHHLIRHHVIGRCAVAIRQRLAGTCPQVFEPVLAKSLGNLGYHLHEADPVAAVEPLVKATAMANRHGLEDLAGLAAHVLRQAHARQPEEVEAEFTRLTGRPWPW